MLDFNRFFGATRDGIAERLCDLLGDGEQRETAGPQWDDRRWTMHTVGEALACRGGQTVNEWGSE
jgi:hypothetical protein